MLKVDVILRRKKKCVYKLKLNFWSIRYNKESWLKFHAYLVIIQLDQLHTTVNLYFFLFYFSTRLYNLILILSNICCSIRPTEFLYLFYLFFFFFFTILSFILFILFFLVCFLLASLHLRTHWPILLLSANIDNLTLKKKKILHLHHASYNMSPFFYFFIMCI